MTLAVLIIKKRTKSAKTGPYRPVLDLKKFQAPQLKESVFLENLLVLIGTGFSLISTNFSLAGAFFGCFSALTLIVHQVIQFLLPSHIALPCFVVRKIPLPLAFDIFCSLGCGLVSREVFKILLDRLFGNLPVLIEYIKNFITKVTQFVLRMSEFQVFEPVNSTALLENIVGTDEDNVLFLEIAIGFALVQGFGIAQCLVVSGSFRKIVSVLHLHFDIKNAGYFAIGTQLLYEHVVTNALVEGAGFDGFLRFGLLQVKNFDSEYSLQEWLRDVLATEYQREHEAVRDGQFLERDVVWIHNIPLRGMLHAV